MDYEYKVLRSKSGALRYAARRPVFVTTYTPDESVSVRVRGDGIDDVVAAAQMGRNDEPGRFPAFAGRVPAGRPGLRRNDGSARPP